MTISHIVCRNIVSQNSGAAIAQLILLKTVENDILSFFVMMLELHIHELKFKYMN